MLILYIFRIVLPACVMPLGIVAILYSRKFIPKREYVKLKTVHGFLIKSLTQVYPKYIIYERRH